MRGPGPCVLRALCSRRLEETDTTRRYVRGSVFSRQFFLEASLHDHSLGAPQHRCSPRGAPRQDRTRLGWPPRPPRRDDPPEPRGMGDFARGATIAIRAQPSVRARIDGAASPQKEHHTQYVAFYSGYVADRARASPLHKTAILDDSRPESENFFVSLNEHDVGPCTASASLASRQSGFAAEEHGPDAAMRNAPNRLHSVLDYFAGRAPRSRLDKTVSLDDSPCCRRG